MLGCTPLEGHSRMGDLVLLKTRCSHCTAPLRLYLSEWQDTSHHHEHPAGRLTVWTCPICNQATHGKVPGRLELVDDGVDGEN